MLNVAAFLLPLCLFAFWFLLGNAVSRFFTPANNPLQNFLLAPALGLALTTLAVFLPSWYGLPVSYFAWPLVIGLLLITVRLLRYRSANISLKTYYPFLLIIFFALIISGYPLLLYGFNWLSYGNDDMTNYCLSASRLLRYGYLTAPDFHSLHYGTDYSQYLWLLMAYGARSGSELLLSLLSAIFRQSPVALFMPLIISLHLVLISSVAALATLCGPPTKRTAFCAGVLAASSALLNLGAFYQLIAQVGGLSLLILSLLLLANTIQQQGQQILKPAIAIAFSVAALMIFYHEIMPFLVLSFILFLIVASLNGWRPQKSFFYLILLACTLLCCLLGKYLPNYVGYQYLILKYAGILVKKDPNLFPYFMGPNGIALLWGFKGIAMGMTHSKTLIAILAGSCMLAITLYYAWQQLQVQSITECTFIVMTAAAVFLWFHGDGFGLFKLAMYLQPFMLAVLATGLMTQLNGEKTGIFLAGLVACASLYSQHYYAERSLGSVGAFVEIPGMSQHHLVAELDTQLAKLPKTTQLALTTNNLVIQKLMLDYTIGKPTVEFSRTFYNEFTNTLFSFLRANPITPIIFPQIQADTTGLLKTVKAGYQTFHFKMPPNHPPALSNLVWESTLPIGKNTLWVLDSTRLSIFNHRVLPTGVNNFFLIKDNVAHNLMIFNHSDLGHNYYLGTPIRIGLYPLQQDYYLPKHLWAETGHYLLFRLIHPTADARVVLTVSTSLYPSAIKDLPDAAVLGTQTQPFPLIGAGSARVISPIIQPQRINNHPYIALDMDAFGRRIPINHPYAYVRDASLVSNADYQHWQRPTQLTQFPADLANANLLYSGIYEDGWLSGDAFIELDKPANCNLLIIRGILPNIAAHFKPNMAFNIRINNQLISTQTLRPGNFTLRIRVPETRLQHIELQASHVLTLPNGDNRKVTVKLTSIGFCSH